MTVFIDPSKTGEWMVTTVTEEVDAEGNQARKHAWCKTKKELLQYLIQNLPEFTSG